MDITLDQISKLFGGTPALAGVNLAIRSGELIALLGPSGSGKTTLLRVIAGLEPASSGRVLFGGEDATQVPVQRRGVGFVFQHYALFRHMTVAGNIAYGLKVRERARRPKRAAIDERVRDLLRLVQLEGLEGRYPTQLSGGQRQRIALARALAVEPRVLLLDEPFGALDAKVRRDLRRWLREIHERTGVTTVFVTHDQDEALELADRVAVMREGRIEQVGTPDEIHDAPANSFVMRFIGDTSHLDVELRDGAAWREGLRLPVEATGQGPAASLHLRPWDVRLVEAGGLPGTVVAVRRTGAGRRAEIRLGQTPDLVEVEIDPAATAARGDSVRVEVLRGRLFPPGGVRTEALDRE